MRGAWGDLIEIVTAVLFWGAIIVLVGDLVWWVLAS